jgi:uncharacterized protein (DUF2235 family)
MAKNIVVCCNGTGNEIEGNLSNVLKLFRILRKNAQQVAYYDPGIGTIGQRDDWARLRQDAKGVFGLATGYGLDYDVLDAYRFLSEHYEPGDNVYLFGFSRGAYSVRMLAGLLHLTGLLRPNQLNICGYLLSAYKGSAEAGDLKIAWEFRRVIATQTVPIRFLGVWDTVASVVVPRKDRFYYPSLQVLPYTRTNPAVEVFRHAISIDEKRRMFQLDPWNEPQEFKPNPFLKRSAPTPQDIKQVWFAGVHADVGGGYPECESSLSKFPLNWMIEEAKDHGLDVNVAMRNHLVLGKPRRGSKQSYVAPDPEGRLHDSLTAGWRLLEWVPKKSDTKGWYIPKGEARIIPENSRVHSSVFQRMERIPSYRPSNLPRAHRLEN